MVVSMVGVGGFKIKRAARKMRLRLPCGGWGGSLSPTQQPNHNSFTISTNAPAMKSSIEAVSRKPKAEDKHKSSTTATKSLCAICLEPLSYSNVARPGQAIFTAQCSHAFHFTCISSNVRHGSVNCPICRAHWTQLPRDLNPPSILPCNQTDPIMQILDNSIANFRVHRRSSLRSARYDDDDPIEPNHSSYNQNRLQLSIQLVPLALSTFPYCMHSSSYSSSPLNKSFPNGQLMPYLSTTNGAAYLSVKLGHQQATDLVLVATPNGPHLRLLKQSMALVVFSLRSIDRLSIVTYSSTATRAFPLKRMTYHGKRAALQVIDRLFFMGDADPGPGLEKGIKILNDRAHQNPQSCILHLSDAPIRCHETAMTDLIHQFHVGCDYGTSFVMHEFEEFLARLLGGVIRDTHLRIGEDGDVVRLGELRGGEERRISIYLNKKESVVRVSYSYIEGGGEECLRTGKIEVSADYGKNHSECTQVGGRDDMFSVVGRTSSVESWDYHDPYMARRWAKHLHGYRL